MYVVVNRVTDKIVKRGFQTRQAATRAMNSLGEKLHGVKIEADHKGG